MAKIIHSQDTENVRFHAALGDFLGENVMEEQGITVHHLQGLARSEKDSTGGY